MQETQEMQVWSLRQEDPLEEEMATHSSLFAWEITASMGSQRVGYNRAQAIIRSSQHQY